MKITFPLMLMLTLGAPLAAAELAAPQLPLIDAVAVRVQMAESANISAVPAPAPSEVKNENKAALAADFEASESFSKISGGIEGQNVFIAGQRSGNDKLIFSIKVPGYETIPAFYSQKSATMDFMSGESLALTGNGDLQVYTGTIGGKAVKFSAEAKYDLGYSDTFSGNGFRFTLKEKGAKLRITGSYAPAPYPPASLGKLLSYIVSMHMSNYLAADRSGENAVRPCRLIIVNYEDEVCIYTCKDGSTHTQPMQHPNPGYEEPFTSCPEILFPR